MGMRVSRGWFCVLVVAALARDVHAESKEITICWADWDPAYALKEVSKDFSKRTGIATRFDLVLWTNFTGTFLNVLNSRDGRCDILIGDSQWIGTAATAGHYLKLNDFLNKAGIDIGGFLPSTVEGYSTWPKGSKSYWALPAMGDALGWTYRKDWFAKPEVRQAFKRTHGYDLEVPRTWTQLRDIARFFQGRIIDGRKRYGAAIYTERASEGITMGVTSALYAWGFQYANPKRPYDMMGYVNSAVAVEALEFYRSIYDCCTPPGHADSYMEGNLESYKRGDVALQMNFFAFFPGIARDPKVGAVSGFFANPAQKVPGSTLGGQGMSIVSYSKKQDLAREYIKWFAQPEVQKKWWGAGGFSCHQKILNAPGFQESAPFAGEFLKAMKDVQDFWQEPAYPKLLKAMQLRVHDYVVAGKGTAKEALDKLVADWRVIFEDEGKL
jgi:multiple sugar transport system substrate-binding protein